MKQNGYMTRALRSRDPRFAKVLTRLGYTSAAPTAAPAKELPQRKQRSDPLDHDKDGRKGGAVKRTSDPAGGDLAALRVEYEQKIGRKPFMGWDAAALRAKIAEAPSRPTALTTQSGLYDRRDMRAKE